MKKKLNQKNNSNALKIFLVLFLSLIISINPKKSISNASEEKQINYKDLYEDVNK